MRNQDSSTYAFLYRNDREWLNNHSPKLRKTNSENRKVDWEKRDQEVLKNVHRSIKDIQNKTGRPKRITIKSIGDVIGERALLEQHLDKMPSTKMYIDTVCESEQEFRLRRIKHVVERMNEVEEEIVTWKVLKRAGIKKKFHDEVKKYLNSLLNVKKEQP